MVFGYLGGRLSERWSEQGALVTGLGMCVLGLAAPLVGLSGADNAVPLGLVTVVSAALAVKG